MWGALRRLARNSNGAVAPTVALSLFALIASGGIAFDYARLAALDTELQDAADHAALAAATQLDRTDDAMDRATNAITADDDEDTLAANFTRFANDNGDFRVNLDEVKFCKSFDDSVADTDAACDDEDVDGSNAVFVVVRTTTRTANYALTPLVAALSGSVTAEAVAGVEGSICNVAPMFVCTEDNDFPTNADIGKGLRMKVGAQNEWAPGNYGLLDFGGGSNGARDALLGFGLNGCQRTDEMSTLPGVKDVTDAMNTRLDVYLGHSSDPDVCDISTGSGCPALSARKDMIVKLVAEENNVVNSTPTISAPACPADPAAAELEFEESVAPVKGFPRDTCHYSTCTGGNFGNGTWDFDGYMAANHPGVATSSVPHAGASPTRYETYEWEKATTGMLDAARFVTTTSVLRQNGRYNHTITSQCTYSTPMYGRTNYPAQKDRRVLPVVAANCDLLHGAGNLGEDFSIIRAFDVFITEPSLQRHNPPNGQGETDDKEIYGEVMGPAEPFLGGGLQYYSRTRPYLVR